jgi:hypothetical protein
LVSWSTEVRPESAPVDETSLLDLNVEVAPFSAVHDEVSERAEFRLLEAESIVRSPPSRLHATVRCCCRC